MYIALSDMPAHARVWVYQAERDLSSLEKIAINRVLMSFTENWQSHGEDLKASFEIIHERFIAVVVDEGYSTTSGCSIDKLVHTIQNLGLELGLNLIDRRIVFRNDNSLHTASLSTFKIMAETGELSQDATIFNTTVSTLSDLKSKFEVGVLQSWAAKYFTLQV